ncbi:MAG: phosphate transporter permease subunit PstC [Aeromicrobium sp.]|nr:phosphate transporter permease subunit PstC [Aeromicrobium sp.]
MSLDLRPSPTNVDDRGRRIISSTHTASDRTYFAGARTAALSTLILMALIGLFLAIGATPAFKVAGFHFLTERKWLPETGTFGIASLLWGTIVVALFALVVAVPIGFGAALFITEYAPASLRRPMVTLVDLMAAVPAIIYGMWGFFFLQGQLLVVARWVSIHFGHVLPFLRVRDTSTLSSFTSSAFIAGIAVGAVVLPTVTSIMREVFAQAPVAEREGAIALGATKWGMIRTVVIPFARSGIVGAVMLGFGRALGETVVVFLIISPMFTLTTHPLQSGTNTIAAHVAARYSESSGVALAGLLGAGLVLFLFTLVINTFARIVVSGSRSGASTEI